MTSKAHWALQGRLTKAVQAASAWRAELRAALLRRSGAPEPLEALLDCLIISLDHALRQLHIRLKVRPPNPPPPPHGSPPNPPAPAACLVKETEMTKSCSLRPSFSLAACSCIARLVLAR